MHLDALDAVDELAAFRHALYADCVERLVVVVGPESERCDACAVNLKCRIPIECRALVGAGWVGETLFLCRIVGLAEFAWNLMTQRLESDGIEVVRAFRQRRIFLDSYSV